MSNNNLNAFLEKLQSMSPTNASKKVFEKKRTATKIYCSTPAAFGKYQLLPINSTISGFPYVTLANTREIALPRKNVNAAGEMSNYTAWIKLLPLNAYTIKDPETGREVSSLTAADEKLLKEAYQVWEELWKETDARNNAMDKVIGKLIRRKNYTIFAAHATNFWSVGDMRNPAKSNFTGLFVVTAKGFLDIVSSSIQDQVLNGAEGDWLDRIYNREKANRSGMMMFSINKQDAPGFNISVTHNPNAGSYLSDVTISDEDMDMYQNPVEVFLGWQASNQDQDKPSSERRLFNAALIREAIDFMITQLAKIRMAKESGTSIQEAIEATNALALSDQPATDTQGRATNDPILAEMAEKAQANPGGYGNANVGGSMETIVEKNDNPFATPPVSHIDPISGAPAAQPFSKPAFAGGFGGGNEDNGLPF